MTGLELLWAMQELARLDIRHTVDQSPAMNRRLMHLSYVISAALERRPAEVVAAVVEDFKRWRFNTMMSG